MAANVDYLKRLLSNAGPAECLFRELVGEHGNPYGLGGETSLDSKLKQATWRVAGGYLYQMVMLNRSKLGFPGSIGMHRSIDHHRLGFWLDAPEGKEERPPVLELIVGCRWRGNEYHAGVYVVFPSDDRLPAGGHMRLAVQTTTDLMARMTMLREADESYRMTAEDVGLACQVR